MHFTYFYFFLFFFTYLYFGYNPNSPKPFKSKKHIKVYVVKSIYVFIHPSENLHGGFSKMNRVEIVMPSTAYKQGYFSFSEEKK